MEAAWLRNLLASSDDRHALSAFRKRSSRSLLTKVLANPVNKHFSVLNTTVNKSHILTFASVRLHLLSLAIKAHQTQCKL
jgi:hypothetical protein